MDVDLDDSELLSEINLLADVMAAALESPDELDERAIDSVLDIEVRP